ncbi:MAG: 3'-5' exonuclease domain-containing protein 2 [Tannerella sp.]|jgi:ribonuclease D|nr:3'-5' exonuclease domain-containing protein 2 [Tannerella sp.]
MPEKREMNFQPSISKEEIACLPIETFEGQIVVVDEQRVISKAIEHLSSSGIVGFDTETRPNFTKNQHHKIALVQLALDDVCYLFRLNRLGGFPSQLIDFINDGKVMKIGLSLQDDFHSIRKRIAIEPANFIDLQKVVPSYGITDISLQKIYAILFGKKISKRSRLSNWDADVLTDAQKQYAALDAWTCLQIYQLLNTRSEYRQNIS